MKRKRLGVNIDHVATIRNARGELYPSPLRAALIGDTLETKIFGILRKKLKFL